MEIRFVLVADAANISREGKLNITGEFNTIFAPSVPVGWPALVVVVRVQGSAAEGQDHAVQVRFVDADGNNVLETPLFPVRLGGVGPGIPRRADLVIGVAGAVFPRYGDYTVNVFVDGRLLGDTPLYVRERPAPQPGAPPHG